MTPKLKSNDEIEEKNIKVTLMNDSSKYGDQLIFKPQNFHYFTRNLSFAFANS